MSRRPHRPVRKSHAQLQAQCDTFNRRYPVGTTVTLKRDTGDGQVTKTRAPAEVLSGHSAVIWLDDVSGCYLLDRVVPHQVQPS